MNRKIGFWSLVCVMAVLLGGCYPLKTSVTTRKDWLKKEQILHELDPSPWVQIRAEVKEDRLVITSTRRQRCRRFKKTTYTPVTVTKRKLPKWHWVVAGAGAAGTVAGAIWLGVDPPKESTTSSGTTETEYHFGNLVLGTGLIALAVEVVNGCRSSDGRKIGATVTETVPVDEIPCVEEPAPHYPVHIASKSGPSRAHQDAESTGAPIHFTTDEEGVAIVPFDDPNLVGIPFAVPFVIVCPSKLVHKNKKLNVLTGGAKGQGFQDVPPPTPCAEIILSPEMGAAIVTKHASYKEAVAWLGEFADHPLAPSIREIKDKTVTEAESVLQKAERLLKKTKTEEAAELADRVVVDFPKDTAVWSRARQIVQAAHEKAEELRLEQERKQWLRQYRAAKKSLPSLLAKCQKHRNAVRSFKRKIGSLQTKVARGRLPMRKAQVQAEKIRSRYEGDFEGLSDTLQEISEILDWIGGEEGQEAAYRWGRKVQKSCVP